MTVRDGLIADMHLYVEPVDTAVKDLYRPPAG